MKRIGLRTIIYSAALMLSIASCKKDSQETTGGDNPGPGKPPPVQNGTTVVSGIVVSEAGQPVAGAKLSAGQSSATTDANGAFKLNNVAVTNKRSVVLSEKDGYFNASKGFIAKDGGITNIRIVMPERKIIASFNATQGTTASLSNASVQIPANGIKDANGNIYNGIVKMAARYVDPESRALGSLMPGGDFTAENKNQQQVQLYSYGALEVELQAADGSLLQLKSGSEATLKFPVANSQKGSAPASVPLWYFDEQKGKWIEEGSVTKQGDHYVGTVKHFTSWNVDVPKPQATMKGRVINCEGKGASGATVQLGQSLALCDENGYYQMTVDAEEPLEGKVLSFDEESSSSEPISSAPVPTGEVKEMNFSTVCGPTIVGRLVDPKGNPVRGTVVIRSDRAVRIVGTDDQGRFLSAVPASINLTIEATSLTGEKAPAQPISTPKDGTKDAGEIVIGQIASIPAGSISFHLNEGGFNNKDISLSTANPGSAPEALFISASNSTGIQKSNNEVSIVIAFDGQSTGVPPQASIYITFPNNEILAGSESVEDFRFNVTKYGSVGNTIEGTFSGRFEKFNKNTGDKLGEVVVTNGKFAVKRSEDF